MTDSSEEVAYQISRALELNMAGRWEDALQVLLEAHRAHAHEDLETEIALHYHSRGVRRSGALALADFDQAEQWSDLPLIQGSRARVLAIQGEYGPAETLAKKVLALDPDDPDARLTLVEIPLRQGRGTEALEILQGILKEFPRWGHPWGLVAEIRRSTGDGPGADAAILKGLGLQPGDPLLLLLKARRRRAEGADDEARRILMDILDTQPDHMDAKLELESFG